MGREGREREEEWEKREGRVRGGDCLLFI